MEASSDHAPAENCPKLERCAKDPCVIEALFHELGHSAGEVAQGEAEMQH